MAESASTCLTLKEIENELREVTNWHSLGIQLGVESDQLDIIEANYPDICRRKAEVIKYWLRNTADASWKKIAIATNNVGGHGNLVQKLLGKATALTQGLSNSSHPNLEDPQHVESVLNQPQFASSGADPHVSMLNVYSICKSEPPLEGFMGVEEFDESDLRVETQKLMLEFGSLVTNVQLTMEKQGVTVEDFALHLQNIKGLEPVYADCDTPLLSACISEVQSQKKLSGAFLATSGYYSWFNHLFVENLIKTFCKRNDDIAERLGEFKAQFLQYCKHRISKCPKNGWGHGRKRDASTIVLKVDEQWTTARADQIPYIRDTVARILCIKKHSLYLRAVENGCIKLTFIVPSFVANALLRFTSREHSTVALTKAGIMELYIDNVSFLWKTGSKVLPFNCTLQFTVNMAAASPCDTRLHTARSAEQVLKYLGAGADPDGRNKSGDTPIRTFVRRPMKDKHKYDCLIALLVHSRCDVDMADDEGNTALHLAEQLNDLMSVKVLLAFNADVNPLNAANETPLDIAHEKHGFDSDMVRILTGVGGLHQDAVRELYKTLGDFTDSVVTEKPPNVMAHSPTEKEKLLAHYEYSGYSQLAHNTRAALKKGIDSHTEGDEGYAAWLQYRELKKAARNKGQSMGSISCMATRYTRTASISRIASPSRGHPSVVPLTFRAKSGEKILCLDGGGIRGLVQIEVLSQLEKATGRRITELFDWIVGTSIGGILALAVVYANLSMDDLRQLYFEMKEKVFKNPKFFGNVGDTPALEGILKKTFGTEMKMCEKTKPKVLITAVDKSTTDLDLRLFNNCFNDEYSQHLVWKVARYTTAVPTYFTECDNYVDGAVVANNPSEYALTEIQEYLDSHGHARGTKIGCLVSVGCGIYPSEKIGNTDVMPGKKNLLEINEMPGRLKDLLQLLFTALTESEDVAKHCGVHCRKQNIPYWRFNPELDERISTIETDNEKLCDIILKAKMLLEAYDAKMDELVQHFYYLAAHQTGAHV